MTPNNNLNVLAFYSSLDEQNHRKSFAYGNVYPLASPDFTLLPFQLKRQSSEAAITVCDLINLHTGETIDILSGAILHGLNVVVFDQYDLIVNYATGTKESGLNLAEGQFYLKISDGVNTWFSDVFNVVSDLSKFIKITYWDNQDFPVPSQIIHYETGFKNWFYVKSELGKPQYPIEEEVETRDGRKFFEKQISEKKYRFEFQAPEYLCDAIRIIRMHDNVLVESKGYVYQAEEILFTPEFLEQGDLAIVQTEFETGFILKKLPGGGFAVEEGEVPPDLATILGFVRYDAEQFLTEQQKQQARDNIGVGNEGGIGLPDGIISGFAVQYSGSAFIYNISAGSLRYNGVVYNIEAGQQTAGTSDPALPRINVLKVSSGGYGFEPGTPATNPNKPVDLGEGWFEITFVLLLAASTGPIGITTDFIYSENTPPNWPLEFSGIGSMNPDYTVSPYEGSKSLLVTPNGVFTVLFDKGEDLNIQDFSTISLQLYLLAPLLNRDLQIRFIHPSGNTISGGWLTVNINKTKVNEWQFVAITIAGLPLTGNVFDRIRIRLTGGQSFTGFKIDNFMLQGGVNAPEQGNEFNSDIVFPIVERGTSKGVFWKGVTDKFGLYVVEEGAVQGGAGYYEKSTFVIEFGDNDSEVPEIEDRILIVQRAVNGVDLTPILEIKKAAIDALVPLLQNGVPIAGGTVIMTPEQIRDALATLTGENRLDVVSIKGIPVLRTAEQTRDLLQTLTGENRLDAASIKNLPATLTAEQVRDLLAGLTGENRLDSAAIKNLPVLRTAEQTRDLLQTLTGLNRLDAAAIKNIPLERPIQTSGSVISFDVPRTYSTMASPLTATTLTINNTGATAVTQTIFHQAASLTISDANCFEAEGSEDYDPARVAIIYIEYYSNDYKRYIITYDKP